MRQERACAIIADLVAPEARGSAYAIYNTFIGLAIIIGGYGIGQIWDKISPHFAFSLSSYGSLFGFAILFVLMILRKKNGMKVA
jgi:predicted MFS family arabinose efflux permease